MTGVQTCALPIFVSGFRGFEDRVKYLEARIRDLNNKIFPLVSQSRYFMSNMVLVSVFDHAVLEFAPCMCANSEAAAIRIFTNEVNRYDPNNLLSTNKSDFSLYVVGEFDLATGCVVNRDPRVLIHGRDILTVSQSRYAAWRYKV